MKFYQLLLLVLLGQIFITLPIQKNYIVIDNSISEENVYLILHSGGLGPVIFFEAPFATITLTVSLLVTYLEQVYFSIYLGNLALNVVLAICVIKVYNIEKGI
jgi:hypothetical protein